MIEEEVNSFFPIFGRQPLPSENRATEISTELKAKLCLLVRRKRRRTARALRQHIHTTTAGALDGKGKAPFPRFCAIPALLCILHYVAARAMPSETPEV